MRARSVTWGLTTGVCLALAGGNGACSSSRGDGPEAAATTSEAVHSAPDFDTEFPAVGDISINNGARYCSGTLIAPDLVLTAAHCFFSLGQGCADEQTWVAGTTFEVSAAGNGASFTTIPVDGIVVHPAAFFKGTTCSPSQPLSCPMNSESGLNFESDLAMMHLATAVTSVTPMRVITDITDKMRKSSASWIHQFIDQTADFAPTSAVRPYIVGWGDGDTVITARRSGQALFDLNPSIWDQLCGSLWTCLGDVNTNSCSIDGKTSDHQITAIREHRLGASGAVASGGDSGGPLIVAGGAQGLNGAGGGFPDMVPAGEPFVMGAFSGGGATLTDKGNPAPSGDLPGDYATTFYGVNGQWIEEIVDDFDGDTIPNEADNCPTVPNKGQADANFDAELELAPALSGGCADYISGGTGCPSYEGQPPGTFPAPATGPYVAHWHKYYPGDACDGNASTAAFTRTIPNPVGTTAPCTVCLTVDTCFTSHTACAPSQTQTCSTTLNSGLRLVSLIGNSTGDARTTTGTTGSAACQCDYATDNFGTVLPNWHRNCALLTPPLRLCTVAQDSLFPTGLGGNQGWFQLTAGQNVFHLPVRLSPLTTTHQEVSDLTVGPIASTLTTWDFPADLSTFNQSPMATSMKAVLWTSVRPGTFNFVGGESPPMQNTPESYLPLQVNVVPQTIYVRTPPPTCFPGRVGPPPGSVFSGNWWVGTPPEAMPYYLVLASGAPPIGESSDIGSQLLGSRFDSTSLGLLESVASGASDLFVGDDIVAGVPFHTASLATVVVEAGTTNVQGAFQVGSDGQVTPVTPSSKPPTSADPPDLRSYDAADAVLMALHVTAVGATVTSLDVHAALAGLQVTAVQAVTGAAPVAPLAMAWNGAEASLYVLDGVPSPGRGKRSSLRLLRIDRDSNAVELWRLRADALPNGAFLSMSLQNERTLTIVNDEWVEVATFDSNGSPLRSLRVRGRLGTAALALGQGFSLPLWRHSEHGRDATSLLDLRLITRADAAPQLCGTRWLRDHVDHGSPSVLGDPHEDCEDRDDRRQGDGH
jgi:hypothetical protein